MTDRWQRIGALFDRMLQLPPDERAAALDASSESVQVIAEVRSLLQAHASADGFLGDLPAALTGRSPSGVTEVAEARPLPSGSAVGPYRILRVAGQGGMGIVYEAEDTRLHRRVALKSLPAALGQDEGPRLRLRQEARAAAALQHPGIATVYALEEIDGGLFISSEFLDGETLRGVMDRSLTPAPVALTMALELARALAAAHDRGIVHRDLKPENIVRTTSGVLKILDFGLAKFDEAAHDLVSRTRLTEMGLIVGTPAYMAPEQLLGQSTDFRVDHFALGIILYELVQGRHPFGGNSLPSTIARILAAAPAPLTGSPHFPAGVWSVVERCLQKDPSARFPSTVDLVDALERERAATAPDFAPGGATSGKPVTSRESLRSSASSSLHTAARLPDEAPLGAKSGAPVSWWQFHQLAATVAYSVMLWPLWNAHRAIERWGLTMFLVGLGMVVLCGGLRLHLWFSSRVYPGDLPSHRAEVTPWLRVADLVFVALLIVAAIALPPDRVGLASTLVACGLGSLVAALFVEPATARAAFQ